MKRKNTIIKQDTLIRKSAGCLLLFGVFLLSAILQGQGPVLAQEESQLAESSMWEVQLLDPSLSESELDGYFQIHEIAEGDEVYDRIYGKSYRENPHIGLEDLRYLTLLHYNFDGQIQVGEMIVNKNAAEDVLNIFRELFALKYEIQSVFLIDRYWTGDPDSTDTASTKANNTSCFNYREITGGGNLSNHALGLAIDLNPLQNPYVWYGEDGSLQCLDENARPYLDRTSGDPHVIVEGDVCWSVFDKYGFSWGGSWNSPIDYQHFERNSSAIS